jgi:hypothetical protein
MIALDLFSSTPDCSIGQASVKGAKARKARIYSAFNLKSHKNHAFIQARATRWRVK